MAKLSGLSERLELASTLVTDGKLDESSAVCRDLEESIRQSLKEATSQSERVMLERLKRANTAMIEKVKKLELQQRRNGRERFTGPVSKVDCGARQDFSDLTFSDGNAAVDQQLVQQFHSTNLELREREVLVDQRTTELMKVERDVVALNECMRDIGELVQQQGETLGENGVIFCHLEEARSRSVDAAQQFAKAGRSRASRRQFEGGATAAAVGGIVGIVGGPIGMAAGAATGALVGSFVGKKIGKLEKSRIDEELSQLQKR